MVRFKATLLQLVFHSFPLLFFSPFFLLFWLIEYCLVLYSIFISSCFVISDVALKINICIFITMYLELMSYHAIDCALTKSICSKSNSPCDDIWRQAFWQAISLWGWNPHDGISALIRRDMRGTISLSLSTIWGYIQVVGYMQIYRVRNCHLQTRKRAVPGTHLATTLILDFTVSRL